MAVFKSTPMTEDVRQSISNQTFAIVRGQNVARKKIFRAIVQKPFRSSVNAPG